VEAVAKNEHYAIGAITPSEIKSLPGNSVAAAMPVAAVVPELPAAVSEEVPRESFFDKLPLDDFKKQNMQHMAAALASGVDKVNALRQGIDEASITVKVEKRKLILSF
jgi:hypothetical protein